MTASRWRKVLIAALCGVVLAACLRSPEPDPAIRVWEIAAVAVCAALASLAALNWRREHHRCSAALGAVLGALFFVAVIGIRVVIPTETGWLMRLDWQWHHLGWLFFRAAPWGRPPGATSLLFSPAGTSVALTDSIPFVALPAKILSPILPVELQYLGVWLVACYALQGAFAGLLIHRFARSPWQVAGAAWLLISAPVLLNRIGHVALASHWLLLAALALAFGFYRPTHRRVWLGALAPVSGLIHAYLAIMVIIVLLAAVVGDGSGWRRQIVTAALIVGSGVVAFWTAGFFAVSPATLAGAGLGQYGANINGFFDAGGASWLVPDLPSALPSQSFESFAFIGSGSLVLLAGLTAGLTSARARQLLGWILRNTSRERWLALAAVLVLCAIGMGPVYTFGGVSIAQLPSIVAAPLALVRVTGRLVWPACYLLIIAASVGWLAGFRRRTSTVALLAAAILQTIDLAPTVITRYREARADPQFFVWSQRPSLEEWRPFKGYAHASVLLDAPCSGDAAAIAPLLWALAHRGMSVNVGHASRVDVDAVRQECARSLAALRNGIVDPSTVVIVTDRQRSALREQGVKLQCSKASGYGVCVPRPSEF